LTTPEASALSSQHRRAGVRCGQIGVLSMTKLEKIAAAYAKLEEAAKLLESAGLPLEAERADERAEAVDLWTAGD
jgi:hypothetical protein